MEKLVPILATWPNQFAQAFNRSRRMGNALLSSCLYRILLPLSLLVAAVFRFNAFSFIYLLLLLVGPLLPGITVATLTSGHSGRYIKAVLGISLIFCICQIVFQIVLLSIGSYGSFINYCDLEGRIFTIIGLHKLDRIAIWDVIRLVGLDFLVLFTSTGVFIGCQNLTLNKRNCEPLETAELPSRKNVRRQRRRASELLLLGGEFMVLLLLAGAAILHPSITSSVYFCTFLAICTWLACNMKLGRTYLLGRTVLLVYTALHFIILYLYQLEYAQQKIDDTSLYARLLGLTKLINATCTDARGLNFLPLSWIFYVHPLLVLGLYWTIATMTRYRLIYPVIEEPYRATESGVTHGDSKQSSQKSSTSWLRRKKQRHDGTTGEEAVDGTVSEVSPLLEDDHTGRNYKTMDGGSHRRESLAIDPNGSVIWSSESEVPESSAVADETTTSKPAVHRQHSILAPALGVFKLIAKGSYVATLIFMMAWSIMYHSWLTFVLLLWSCLVWMMPNSRQACLRSSPALVMYAEALLLLQYIYGLNLTDDELPRKIEHVNLAQIGLVKYPNMSYQPLGVKILYTIMFWITLRQYMVERRRASEKNLAEGVMMEPFNISYSTAQPNITRPDLRRQMSIATTAGTSLVARRIGEYVKLLLTKYWIWVVACMLMVISLGGERVVVYRIVYMLLFLFFILMFQFSYQAWRKIMCAFWFTVIFFSMLVLILIYTYQFEKFPEYWEKYLGIPLTIQADIGLKVYESDPWTLFSKLLTPTFFLIITIIQLHYFHKDFLRISDINYSPTEEDITITSILHASTPHPSPRKKSDVDVTHVVIEEKDSISEAVAASPPSEGFLTTSNIEQAQKPSGKVEGDGTEREGVARYAAAVADKEDIAAVKSFFRRTFDKGSVIFTHACEILWRILEIHMIKIVLFSVLCLATFDVCAVHVFFVIFVVVALPLRSLQTFLSHCCSVWVSILLLSKMIYQLEFVDQYGWKLNCTGVTGVIANTTADLPPPFNDTIDNRIWIGFKKTDKLTSYCKGYIGLIVVLTLQAVVKVRQRFHRYQQRANEPKIGIIFPEITRSNADNGLISCIKYLANYCFYKFGVEICFVTIVTCVGVRLDIYAVLSAVWLAAIFLLRRKTLAKVWPFYISYQCIVLPLQYLLCVGIPPGLCIEYPWTFEMDEELREWLFFPDFLSPPNSYKILVDFFQILFACCQLHVFRIEMSQEADTYEGGSNKEIYSWDSSGNLILPQNNPIPDFVSNAKSYLDMLKVIVFFSFYWLTLAVVFLAGTSRVSLFAMGYVIGCFIFLWNGNEFYLKPMRVLLRMWNCLLIYNVGCILFKSILQVVGCVFLSRLYSNFCWLVQLLGIACLKKLEKDPVPIPQNSRGCEVPVGEAGLLWDGICFAFLLLQKRLFCSFYFQHLISEIRAQQVLASRGAELINEIQMKMVKEQEEAEKLIMEKIKMKMDRIRAHQQKMHGGDYVEPNTHFTGDEYASYSTPMYSVQNSPRSPRSPLSGERSSQTLSSPLHTTMSPSSAAFTASLEGYMEPRIGDPRLSASSFPMPPPHSPSSSSSLRSYPIFSPPPYPYVADMFRGPYMFVYPSSLVSVRQRGQQPSQQLGVTRTKPLPPRRKQSLRSARSSTPSSHHACVTYPELQTGREPLLSPAIRSGDYYMFDEYPEEELDLELTPKVKSDLDDDDAAEVKEKGLNALLSQAMKGNLKHSAEEIRRVSEDTDDVGESSQMSPIISADRSPGSRRTSVEFSQLRRRRMSTGPSEASTVPGAQSTPAAASPPLSLRLSPSGDDEYKTPLTSPPEDGKDEEEQKLEEEEEEPKRESLFTKICNWTVFAGVFLESALISATAKLNSISKDYRFVARQLAYEKKMLKEKFSHIKMTEDWTVIMEKEKREIFQQEAQLDKEKPPGQISVRLDGTGSEEYLDSVEVMEDPEFSGLDFQKEQPAFIRFVVAMYYAVISRSELMCYLVIVVNQMKSASILSLPLPMMAFLWGTLSVPRPTKTFWITIITYTEAVVVVKYMFQFGFFPWNGETHLEPFWPPRILGIEQKENYAIYDLVLLLVVFFHRFMLKSLGLWKDTDKSTTGMGTPVNTLDDKDTSEDPPKEKEATNNCDNPTTKANGEKSVAISEEQQSVEEQENNVEESGMQLQDRFKQYLQPFRSFFTKLLYPEYRVTVDVYAFMFFCDFINFLIVVFGYWAFGTGGGSAGSVASYFEENKVPIPFLIMLLAQFALLVIDRALYLRKFILGKLVFQIALAFIIHFWMFFVLPGVTGRAFYSDGNMPPKLWYFVKCIYLLLSAYQIRSGYPTRILGNFFCKKYNYVNLFFFKGYMLIPFLYELRSLMDWIWTDTSLNISNWLKMEDIFANIFLLKCQRRAEEEYPTPRGSNRPALIKYGMGGSLLFVIILCIWFPLVLFALGNTVGIPNFPYDCTVELTIGGYEPIFKMSAQQNTLSRLAPNEWTDMVYNYRNQPAAQNFLNNYDINDVTLVQLNGNSTAVWVISPPSQQALINDLLSPKGVLTVKLVWTFSRISKSQDVEKTVGNERIIELDPVKGRDLRQKLARMLNGSYTEAVTLVNIFPTFVRVPPRGKVDNVKAFYSENNWEEEAFRNISLFLRHGRFGNLSSMAEWWEVREECSGNDVYPFLNIQSCKYLRLIAFNDKTFPSELSVLSGYGIVGLYTTFVLVVSRVVRGVFAGMSFNIMFDDMPYVDRVLQLCLDIYLVRESGEFALEEDLFARLIFLYRSPETLIKWTRYPTERSPNSQQQLENQ